MTDFQTPDVRLAGYLRHADYSAAYSILVNQGTPGDPVALPIAASSFIGRKSTGGIADISVADSLTLLGMTNATLAAAVITDHALVRGDGGARGIQSSRITVDDSNNMSGIGTVGCGPLTATTTGTGAASIGSEILLNSTFDSDLSNWTAGDVNWSWGAGGTADHAAGATGTLTQTVATTNGSHYQFVIVLSAYTAGTLTATLTSSLGSESFALTSATTFTYSFKAGAASSTLTLTPGTTFVGSITSVSLKLITQASTYAIGAKDVGGSYSGLCSIITDSTLYNLIIGVSSGTCVTSGVRNVIIGPSSSGSNTTGTGNVSIGYSNAASNTAGSYNVSIGYESFYSNYTGGSDVAVGAYSLRGLLNTSNTVGLGANSGRYYSTGSLALTSATQCTYLGANSRANADTMTNEIVIGYNAVGAGSNTATIGNVSIVQTVLRGNFGTLATYGTSAAGVLGLASGTAPSTSPADAVQVWSADLAGTAGLAALHVRSETGAIAAFGKNWLLGGATAMDATAVGVLQITNGTAPGEAVANAVEIYSSDNGSNTVLSVYAEDAVSTSYPSDSTTTIPIRYNGTVYHLATKVAQ